MSEFYNFDDGHCDPLNWSILKKSEAEYEGHEASIDGSVRGEQRGTAFHWEYSRAVPDTTGERTTFGFHDWFWLLSQRCCVNRLESRSSASKWRGYQRSIENYPREASVASTEAVPVGCGHATIRSATIQPSCCGNYTGMLSATSAVPMRAASQGDFHVNPYGSADF
jgi:hypothetical protein